MARPRELLSLANIADETGISYATLRNYALKYADEIPSEGIGRSTRYPRAAVKVFQRLRKESKPGRKPRNLMLEQAPAPAPALSAVPAPAPVRPETPREAPRQTASDPGGIERELAAIRVFLGSIAQSLDRLVREPRNASAPAPATAAPVEAAPAVTAVESAPEPDKRPEAPARVAERLPIPPEMREVKDIREPGIAHRRLHSLPKVMGQRGRRPE